MQQLRNLYDHKEVAGALFRDSISIQKIMRGDQYEGFDRFVDRRRLRLALSKKGEFSNEH